MEKCVLLLSFLVVIGGYMFLNSYTSQGAGSFFNHRYMDNLFLNRMNSRQGIVMKKQNIIFDISIGSLHFFKFF